MLVTEGETQDRKQPSSPVTAPVPEELILPPPPAYERTYQSLQAARARDPLLARPVPHGERAGPRFLKAFLVAGAIWVLLGLFTGATVNAGRGRWDTGGDSDGTVSGPRPADGTPRDCIDGVGFARIGKRVGWGRDYNVTASFVLPADAAELYFLARGTRAVGTVGVRTREDGGRDVEVLVSATYQDVAALRNIHVCALSHDDAHGLGIFTPSERRPNGRAPLRWTVVVALPAGAQVPVLRTEMPIFAHTLNGSGLSFGALSLQTTNARISLDDVVATTLTVQTTNGPISGALRAGNATLQSTNGRIDGVYNVSGSLVLATTNSPIDVAVALRQTGAFVRLATSNSSLVAQVDLAGTAHAVSARTSNALLALALTGAPADHVLALDAQTTNGRAVVALPPAFEGRFVAQTTSHYRVALHTPDVADPRGEGRRRVLDALRWDAAKSSVKGTVRWGEEDDGRKRRGSVEVETTNGPIELTV